MNTAENIEILKSIFPEDIQYVEEEHHQFSIHVQKNKLKEVLHFLKVRVEPGYQVLMDLTGVDYLRPEPYTNIIYLLHNPTTLERILVTVRAGRHESLPSVVDLWESANWYERELYDLFGVVFDNHPSLTRILMPDNWVGHPLRKDYALTEEPVEFKNSREPKIPSQVIPYVTEYER